MATPKVLDPDPTTVKLVPFTHIEPFSMVTFLESSLYAKRYSQLPSWSSILVQIATSST